MRSRLFSDGGVGAVLRSLDRHVPLRLVHQLRDIVCGLCDAHGHPALGRRRSQLFGVITGLTWFIFLAVLAPLAGRRSAGSSWRIILSGATGIPAVRARRL